MLFRSHAAHAASTHLHNDVRATWHLFTQVANRVWRNAATRRELADLDDRMLADIGVTRGAIRTEMDRFPWDDSARRGQPRHAGGSSVWQHVGTMWQRHRSRQRIAELDADLLKDIGVSFTEAEAEANKPFWRA
jgi:uncharacterized protein YjiS (DUF1127 family)